MSVDALDALDRQLLNELQEGIELVERPYQALADKLGTTEEDVLDRIRGLKGNVIRQFPPFSTPAPWDTSPAWLPPRSPRSASTRQPG